MGRSLAAGLAFALLLLAGAAQARLSPALERTLVAAVRRNNQQVRIGRQPMDLGLVFRLVGRTLEKSGGDEQAALRTALRSASRSASREGPLPGRVFSSSVIRALKLACYLHRDQLRKGTTVPYLSHLLGVAGIVIQSGGSDAELVAALLHDAVEDQGGAPTLRLIRRTFGPQVARIVNELSEPPGPWQERKRQGIDAVARGLRSPSAQRVKLADLLHNSGTLTRGARREGDAFWEVFTGQKAGTLWYYDSMAAAFRTATTGNRGLRGLAERLERQVQRLHESAR